jgi:hypothetical protein
MSGWWTALFIVDNVLLVFVIWAVGYRGYWPRRARKTRKLR